MKNLKDINVEINMELLVKIDSITSLLAYRYSHLLSEETAKELKEISETCRAIYNSNKDKIVEVDNRPHSRACGIFKHEHGPDCNSNCPTCGGK